MAAVEEEDTRPDVNRLLVVAGKIVVESREEELLDEGRAIARR